MGIFRRTADIFAANLNDLVDRFEDPERMLRHALRELDALLQATSSAAARSIAMEKLLSKSHEEHAAQAGDWQRRATDALNADDEPLARKAIACKLDHERAAFAIGRQLADVHAANETLRAQLAKLQEKRTTARSKLALLAAQQSAADAQRQVVSVSRAANGSTSALARFERFYERAELAQAEATALAELDAGEESGLAAQFDQCAIDRAIEAELQKLRAASADPA